MAERLRVFIFEGTYDVFLVDGQGVAVHVSRTKTVAVLGVNEEQASGNARRMLSGWCVHCRPKPVRLPPKVTAEQALEILGQLTGQKD